MTSFLSYADPEALSLGVFTVEATHEGIRIPSGLWFSCFKDAESYGRTLSILWDTWRVVQVDDADVEALGA